MSDEKPRRGRRTKEEEALAYLEEAGLSREVLAQLKDGAGPAPTFEEMRDKLLFQLNMQIPHLKGIALTQALKTVEALAATARGVDDEEEQVFGVDDLLAGAEGLPAARRLELVNEAITDMERRLERLKLLRGEVVAA